MTQNLILDSTYIARNVVPHLIQEAQTTLENEPAVSDRLGYFSTAVALTVLGNGEIEVHDEATRAAFQATEQILAKARTGEHNDLMLHIVLWWRFLHGDEESIPEATRETIRWLRRRPRRRRR